MRIDFEKLAYTIDTEVDREKLKGITVSEACEALRVLSPKLKAKDISVLESEFRAGLKRLYHRSKAE